LLSALEEIPAAVNMAGYATVFRQPVNQSTNRSINGSIDQSINYLVRKEFSQTEVTLSNHFSFTDSNF